MLLVACEIGGEGDAVGDGELDERGHALVFGQGEEVSGDAGGGGLVGFLLLGELRLRWVGDGGFAVGVELFGVDIFVVVCRPGPRTWRRGGVGGIGALAVGDLLDGAAVGEEGEGLLGLQVEGGVVVEALVEGVVVDGGGVELLLEPLSGVMARTCSTSPGRGPKVKRLRSCWVLSRGLSGTSGAGFAAAGGLGLVRGFFWACSGATRRAGREPG